jgi:hypothetical protein
VLPPAQQDDGGTHMLFIICSQPELRATLLERAARYCPDAADRDLLVSRTVSAVCDDPELTAGPRIQVALFRVMHRLVREEAPQRALSTESTFAAA